MTGIEVRGTEWGFLRETRELALAAGKDKDTGLCRSGLDDYLKVIYPEVNDWVHDKTTGIIKDDGKVARNRPDYRSETLKLVIEVDGLPHYTSPEQIRTDERNTALYLSNGYKVVRIPYFIQLTEAVVDSMFGVKVNCPLFDGEVPSIGPKGRNSPAFLCLAGIRRMAREFDRYPDQYAVNLAALKAAEDDDLTEWQQLHHEYMALHLTD